MAGRIKGITVELNADTTSFNKALRSVQSESKKVQTELKAVDRALKLDPTNTELLAQKQELLTKATDESKAALVALKKAKEQADADMANGTEVNETQYRKLQREIVFAEEKVKKLEQQTKEFGSVASQQLKNAGDSVQKFGSKVESAGQKLKGVSTVAAGALTGLVAITKETEEYRTDLSKLENNAQQAGVGINTVEQSLKDLNAITGETDSNIEALSNLMQAGFTDAQITQALDDLSGAVLSFPDTLKIESLADSLQETIATGSATGQFAELLERSGIVLDDFNAKMAMCTTTSQKQNMALEYLAKTGMAEANAAYRENNAELIASKDAQFELNDALAEIGATVNEIMLPILQKLAEIVSNISKKFSNLSPTTKKVVIGILGVTAALAPLLIIIGKLSTGIGAIIKLLPLFSSPAGLIIIAITAVIAAIVLLIKNFDRVKWAFGELWEHIKSICSKIVDGIKSIFGKVVSFFKDNWKEILLFIVNPFAGAFALLYKKCDAFREFINNLVSKIKDIFASLWSGLKTGFITVVNYTIKGLNKLIDGINKFVKILLAPINLLIAGLNKIPGVDIPKLELAIPDIPEIPMMAKGGVLGNGQAIIAEAGPELLSVNNGKATVTPLTNSAKNSSTGKQVTIQNVTIDAHNVSDFNKVVNMVLRQTQARRAY